MKRRPAARSERSARYHAYGAPSDVLRVGEDMVAAIATDELLVRTRLVPLHRGDMLAIAGSPAFGSAPPLPIGGAIPGLEGMGVVAEVGSSVEGFVVGQRVAYFPVAGTWRSHVAVKASALAVVPDDVADTLAARLLIDVATASLVVRRTLRQQPRPDRVLQSGAGSAVGRIISALLTEAGVQPVRLAHGANGAQKAAAAQPGSPVFATMAESWREELDSYLKGNLPTVAIDGVGGDLLGDVAMRVAAGGLIVQYGTLGGPRADIRPIVPRRLRIEGISLGTWFDLPDDVRAADRSSAFHLAQERSALFGEAKVFDLDDLTAALEAMDAAGREDAILLSLDGAQ